MIIIVQRQVLDKNYVLGHGDTWACFFVLYTDTSGISKTVSVFGIINLRVSKIVPHITD